MVHRIGFAQVPPYLPSLSQKIHQSLHHQFSPFIERVKNQFYRFLTRPKIDWRRLLYRTVKSFFRIVSENSTDDDMERYFILDDTMIEKSGIIMKGISRAYDHVAQKSAFENKLLHYPLPTRRFYLNISIFIIVIRIVLMVICDNFIVQPCLFVRMVLVFCFR